jgi:hypothetical protein
VLPKGLPAAGVLKEKPPVGFWPKRLRAGVAVAAAAGAADAAPSALPKLKPALAAGAGALRVRKEKH